MFRPALIALVAVGALSGPVPALAQFSYGPPSAVPAGDNCRFPDLVRIAQRAAGGGTHIGSDFDERSGVYQFKFIRDGVVTLVYVDGRSCRVVGRERG